MKMSTNQVTQCLLVIAVLLLLPCTVVFAESAAATESDANAVSKVEVLTTLEQRMQKRIL